MKKSFIYILGILMMAFSGVLYSCADEPDSKSPYTDNDSGDDTDLPDYDINGIAESTILVYAVATNNLGVNLVADKNEILAAASSINLNKNNILVYETRYEIPNTYSSTPIVNLVKLTRTGIDEYDWEVVKEFDLDKASLDPSRISEVIDYVAQNYPALNNGLIFWSHSTGSTPYEYQEPEEETGSVSAGLQYSFGQDILNKDGKYYQINVEDLANALPDHSFDYIWFDSCYMGNIETAYQLRNKCDFFVAYPTEVVDVGMPYDRVLPFLAKSQPKLQDGVEAFFNYFDTEYRYRVATVAMLDMSKIELLADFCRSVYSKENEVNNVSSFIKYTRSSGPFYDLGDYTKAMCELSGFDFSNEEWDDLLNVVMPYRAATPTDFNGRVIPAERYSGLSTHIYRESETSDSESYYRSLDWYKSVFEDNNSDSDTENNTEE